MFTTLGHRFISIVLNQERFLQKICGIWGPTLTPKRAWKVDRCGKSPINGNCVTVDPSVGVRPAWVLRKEYAKHWFIEISTISTLLAKSSLLSKKWEFSFFEEMHCLIDVFCAMLFLFCRRSIKIKKNGLQLQLSIFLEVCVLHNMDRKDKIASLRLNSLY